jgi:hypothetical protein
MRSPTDWVDCNDREPTPDHHPEIHHEPKLFVFDFYFCAVDHAKAWDQLRLDGVGASLDAAE